MNEQLKPFQQVLVRDDSEGKWHCDLFSYASRGDVCGDYYVCVGGIYVQCIPYEGNEALLGTTDASKPKRWRAKKGEGFYAISMTDGEIIVVNVIKVFSSDSDERYYKSGNYFRTKEEAQAMADNFKQLLKGE